MRIENPDGLSDERSGLLYFFPRPSTDEPGDTGSDTNSNGRDTGDTAASQLNGESPKNDIGCSSVTQRASFSWLALVIGFIALSRREDD